jgi:hypothetical protein
MRPFRKLAEKDPWAFQNPGVFFSWKVASSQLGMIICVFSRDCPTAS